MNHLRLALIVTVVAGCSTPSPQPAAPSKPGMSAATQMVFYSQPYTQPDPGPDLKAPQFCHLGDDCMALDSRPFAACLVDGKPCEGEGVFMQAAPSVVFKSVSPEEVRRLQKLLSKK